MLLASPPSPWTAGGWWKKKTHLESNLGQDGVALGDMTADGHGMATISTKERKKSFKAKPDFSHF